MADDIMNPKPKDKTPIWLSKPGVEPRVFPAHAVKKLLADKNKGWEVCEPGFVANTKVRPKDEGKTNAAIKNANTDMNSNQFDAFTKQTNAELKEYANKNEIDVSKCKNKKEILEAIEKSGKLLK